MERGYGILMQVDASAGLTVHRTAMDPIIANMHYVNYYIMANMYYVNNLHDSIIDNSKQIDPDS